MKKINVLLFLLAYLNLSAFELDKKIQKDENWYYAAHYNIPIYSTVSILAIAMYEGTNSRLGKTAFKSLDAGIISQITTEGIKSATGRLRPRDTDYPYDWGKGGKSFPSGHVSGMTALVTPFILEYKEDNPYIHLLWALPAYQMVARVKAQAHWQSDVIAGAFVGFCSGYLTHTYDIPIILYFSKDNAMIGFKQKF